MLGCTTHCPIFKMARCNVGLHHLQVQEAIQILHIQSNPTHAEYAHLASNIWSFKIPMHIYQVEHLNVYDWPMCTQNKCTFHIPFDLPIMVSLKNFVTSLNR